MGLCLLSANLPAKCKFKTKPKCCRYDFAYPLHTLVMYVCLLGLAMRMRNMRMMRIMRICGICGCVCGLKISSTLYTYEYLPKMATFWARNGSAWLCFQFWVPKISLLFIPPGFIHPQEWKLRVQNHKILVKKRWFFFTIDAVYAHWCASDAHRCASAKIGAWPTLIHMSTKY